MRTATVIAPGGGELIGDSPDRRVEVLSDDASLHATWSRFGPGREGADLHVHRRHSDLFYVLDGELTLRVGPRGEPLAVPAGTLARIPPLVVHGFRNASDADVSYLNLHAPGCGFADYLRALRDGGALAYDQHDPPPDGGRSPSDVVIGRPAAVADVAEIAVEEVVAQPGAGADAEVRGDGVESIYVLEGELAIRADGSELRAGAGAWLQVPAGVPRSDPAAVGGPARFLRIRTPGSR